MKKLVTLLLLLPHLIVFSNNKIVPAGAATISGGGIVCDGEPIPDITITLTGTAPWTITYTDGVTPTTVMTLTSTYVISNGTDGNYSLVSVSDAGGPSTVSGSATITTLPLPTATISGGGTICAGDPPNVVVTLTGTSSWLVLFTLDGVPSTFNSVSSSFSLFLGDGTYSLVSVSDATGCSGTVSGSATVITNPLPIANAGTGGTLDCTTTTTTLTATGGGTYFWTASGGGNIISGASTASATVNAAGTYTVTVTDANGCSDTDIAMVTSDLTPSIANAGADQVLDCNNTTVNLTASGGGTYSWVASGGGNIISGASSSTITADAAGNYTVTVTGANGCTDTDDIVVTNSPSPPSPIVFGGNTYCQGDFMGNLFATGLGGIISWYDDAGLTNLVGNSPIFTPVSSVGTTNYYATETLGGCESAPSLVTVTVNPLPTFIIGVIQNPSGCGISDASITINGLNPSTTYNLTYNINAITVGPQSITSDASGDYVIGGLLEGIYSNITIELNGCSTTDGTSIILVPIYPTSPIAFPNIDTAFIGDTVIINAIPAFGGTITWYDSAFNQIAVGTTYSVTDSTVGTYIFYATETLNGCEGPFSSVSVTFENPVKVTIVVTDEMIGNDGSINITVTDGTPPFLFNWDTDGIGDFDDPEDLTGLTSGSYNITVRDDNGYELTETIIVGSQVGIAQQLNSSFIQIYPNPNNGSFMLQFKDVNSVNSIKIYDTKGSLIYSKDKLYNEKINLPKHVSGLFYVIIHTSNNFYKEKLIILK